MINKFIVLTKIAANFEAALHELKFIDKLESLQKKKNKKFTCLSLDPRNTTARRNLENWPEKKEKEASLKVIEDCVNARDCEDWRVWVTFATWLRRRDWDSVKKRERAVRWDWKRGLRSCLWPKRKRTKWTDAQNAPFKEKYILIYRNGAFNGPAYKALGETPPSISKSATASFPDSETVSSLSLFSFFWFCMYLRSVSELRIKLKKQNRSPNSKQKERIRSAFSCCCLLSHSFTSLVNFLA